MPLRLFRSWEPTHTLEEKWVRPEPWAGAAYVPGDATFLDGNATGLSLIHI